MSKTVIPKMFTDGHLETEKRNLERDMANCEKCSTELDYEIQNCNDRINSTYGMMKELARHYLTNGYSTDEAYRQAKQEFGHDKLEQQEKQLQAQRDRIREEARSTIHTCVAEIEYINSLLQIKPKARMEKYYSMLLSDYKSASLDEEKLVDLASCFREMEGYRDTTELAKECELQVLEIKERRKREKEEQERREEEEQERIRQEQYDRLVQEKDRATAEYEYQVISMKFWEMHGYKNSAELAKECEAQYNILKERREKQERQEQYKRLCEQYNQLYEKSKSVSSEEDYQQITSQFQRLCTQFQEIQNYNETTEYVKTCTQWANEANNRYQILKQRREAEDRERQRIEEHRRKTAGRIGGTVGIVVGISLGLMLGGYISSFVSSLPTDSDSHSFFAGCVGTVVGIICAIFAGGWVAGCAGFIITWLVLLVFASFFTSFPGIFIVIGVVVGGFFGSAFGAGIAEESVKK